MPNKKSEKIKIMIVMGLSVVFLISGYFRLIHGRTKRAAPPVSTTPGFLPADIPAGADAGPVADVESLREEIHTRSAAITSMKGAVRDIFSDPLAVSSGQENRPKGKPESPPPMSLKGTIVGGDSPIAIIDGRFVRVGDTVGDYRVFKISKDTVLLSSGNREVFLEVLDPLSKRVSAVLRDKEIADAGVGTGKGNR